MNPYELMIPQFLAGAAIVVIALRAVRQSRRETEAHGERLARRQENHDRYIDELKKAVANPGLPASQFVTEWAEPSALRLTLDMNDPKAVPDIARVARDIGELLEKASQFEEALGGRGLVLTAARAEPGRVVLTLTPRDPLGSAGRVRQVTNALNGEPDTDRRVTGPTFAAPSLPTGVSGVRAELAIAV